MFTIPDTFRYSYADEIALEYQQLMSRLEPYVTVISEVGLGWVGTKLGAGDDEGTEIIADGGDTNPTGVNAEVRHITARSFKVPKILKRLEMQGVGAAGNQYTENVKRNQMATAARDTDRIIIGAMLGPMRTGQDGLTTVNLNPAHVVAVDYVHSGVAANSGLTPAKITEIIRRLTSAEVTGQDVDQDQEVYLALGSKQIQDLQNNPLIMNNQNLYAQLNGLREGQVLNILGIMLKRVSDNILPIDPATGIRTCIAWVRSAVYFNRASDVEIRMDVLPTKEHSVQIVAYYSFGGGRMDELGVLPVYCDEVL